MERSAGIHVNGSGGGLRDLVPELFVGKINIFLVAQQLYIRYNQTILNQAKPNKN